ncbi:hypothetical protein KIK06_23515 [Nocardiopsis sp. EMB25]|uniref:hypothetical protein n=1 Tax=Nocardiopsis sp. EMB25 TaxID=2835867 RepID=UPI002283B98F|nr:hypothetical protein [Nocardiopsis sp. EMB25]MCY9786856.1 hypothetical protein [Nocardiopsis sp. EMB25]
MNNPPRIPVLQHGDWTTTPSPIDLTKDLDAELHTSGYEAFSEYGRNVHASLALIAYHRAESPSYLVIVDFPERYEVTGATTLPDFMKLLADWLPAVQAAAVTEIATDLRADKDTLLADGIQQLAKAIRGIQ